MKKERKVIHVYIKDQNKHYYFGSVKAIYDVFDSVDIGLMYQSLINYYSDNNVDVYENSKCIIRKGTLITTPTLRGQKKS
jgi:hypothetical protein